MTPEYPSRWLKWQTTSRRGIYDIIGKEDVDGVPHYWVQWNATLVPKYEMERARALIAKFEAGLRAQRKQKGEKGQDRQAITKARTTGGTQQRKERGQV
jgi:hypothetical protein